MRKLILLLITVSIISCNQQKTHNPNDGFVINAKVTNFKEGTMMYLNDPDTQVTIDSVAVTNAEFQLKGKVDRPKRLFLSEKYVEGSNGNRYTSFWVDNAIITFEGDYNDFKSSKVEGLEIHKIDQALSDLQKVNSRKMDSLSKLYNDDNENNRKISMEVQKAIAVNDSITTKFIKENPNNIISLSNTLYLKDRFSKEDLNTIYNALDQDLKESVEGKSLKQYMDIPKIVKEGDQLADVQGETLKGETKNLADIVKENEYTILDFWAAGCAPCRMQSKQYAKIYELYKEKGLEIVSFSIDKNKEHWEKASQEDNITWLNISDLKGMDGIAAMTYGIRGIPNSFLINKKGEIVSEFQGFHPDRAPFEDKLKSFFENGTE